MPESVADLIKDLTIRLGEMAQEFGARAEIVTSGRAPSDEEHALTELAHRVLAHRRARHAYFPSDLFHEPAWDMLIGLFITRDDSRPMYVKALVAYTDAPATTSQRWIDQLDKIGLVRRTVDQFDRRRVEVAITETGREAMTHYLRGLLPHLSG